LEVGARVGPHGEARLGQEAGDHAGGRALAVRAREVDDRIGHLRVAEHIDEAAHPLERQPFDLARRGLEVDVAIQPLQSIPQAHPGILTSPRFPRVHIGPEGTSEVAERAQSRGTGGLCSLRNRSGACTRGENAAYGRRLTPYAGAELPPTKRSTWGEAMG